MSRVEPVDPRVRLAIAQWPPDAPLGAVTTFCVEHSVSRKTFYAIRNRAVEEGQAAALDPTWTRGVLSPAIVGAHHLCRGDAPRAVAPADFRGITRQNAQRNGPPSKASAPQVTPR